MSAYYIATTVQLQNMGPLTAIIIIISGATNPTTQIQIGQVNKGVLLV